VVIKTPERELADLRAKLAAHGINNIEETAQELHRLRTQVAMHALPDEELQKISDRARAIVEERANAKQVRMLDALTRLGVNRASDPKSFAAILSRNVHFDRLIRALEEAAQP